MAKHLVASGYRPPGQSEVSEFLNLFQSSIDISLIDNNITSTTIQPNYEGGL